MLRTLFLSCEIFVGFGPLITLWLFGIIMGLPVGVAAVYSGEPIGYSILALLMLGSFGVWGVIQVIKKLIWPEINYPINRYRKQLICGCLASALCGLALVDQNKFMAGYMVVPIIVTVHLYHICSPHS